MHLSYIHTIYDPRRSARNITEKPIDSGILQKSSD